MELYKIHIKKNNGRLVSDYKEEYILGEYFFETEKWCKENIPGFVNLEHMAGETGTRTKLHKIMPLKWVKE